jgi:hypothetical protein
VANFLSLKKRSVAVSAEVRYNSLFLLLRTGGLEIGLLDADVDDGSSRIGGSSRLDESVHLRGVLDLRILLLLEGSRLNLRGLLEVRWPSLRQRVPVLLRTTGSEALLGALLRRQHAEPRDLQREG